jgi:hypothetical protein
MPVVAGLATLAVLVLAILVLLPYLARESPETPKDLRQLIEAGQRALDEGRFNQAAQDLRQAWLRVQEQPRLLPLAEQRELYQAHRQADLLDGLLSQSLSELLAQAQAAGREEEWQARFSKDYQGKSVIFDDEVVLDGDGRATLRFTSIQSGEVLARLALEELRLLFRLPLGQPQRVIFGARLARFAREPGGHWVIRFEPESGVLLTDPGAFRACAPILLDRDPDIVKVLDRQTGWVEQPAARLK